MSDRDTNHTLSELQEARAEVDRLRQAIRQHQWEMRDYRGAFYDEALWQAVPETQESSHDQPSETKAAGIVANHAGHSVGIRGVGQ